MNRLLLWTTLGWAAVLMSSVVSMMAVFMGSGSGDLRALLHLQLATLPLALLTIGACLAILRRSARGPAVAALWRLSPGWMVFAVASGLSLVLIAELTFVLVRVLSDTGRPWLEHVPAATAFGSSLALAASFALLKRDNG